MTNIIKQIVPSWPGGAPSITATAQQRDQGELKTKLVGTSENRHNSGGEANRISFLKQILEKDNQRKSTSLLQNKNDNIKIWESALILYLQKPFLIPVRRDHLHSYLRQLGVRTHQ